VIDTGPNGPRGLHRFTKFKLAFLSAVDHPAQAPALAVLVAKRNPEPPSENTAMTPEQIAALQTQLAKALKRAEAIEGLTGAQLDVYKSLNEGGRERFLDASPAVREAEVAAAQEADKIEVDLGDGVVVRKSAGPVAIQLAKMNKQLKERAEASELVSRMSVYKARVKTDLEGLPLDEDVGVALLVAVDGIEAAKREKVLTVLKAKADAFRRGGRVFGVIAGDKARVQKQTTTGADMTSDQQFVLNVRKYQADNKIEKLTDAYSAYEQTPEGQALLAERAESFRATNG
jgi:prefoldin subunit 5